MLLTFLTQEDVLYSSLELFDFNTTKKTSFYTKNVEVTRKQVVKRDAGPIRCVPNVLFR